MFRKVSLTVFYNKKVFSVKNINQPFINFCIMSNFFACFCIIRRGKIAIARKDFPDILIPKLFP